MKAFQDLLLQGSIKTEYLNTHCFNFKDAPKAYDLITEKKDFYLGISLKYDINDDNKSEKIITKKLQGEKRSKSFSYRCWQLCSKQSSAIY